MFIGIGIGINSPNQTAPVAQTKPEKPAKPLEYEKKPITPSETKPHG